MKIAIVTDQHFGARKGSKVFHDYFLKFYNEVFFPTLEEQGITTVIDMGDTFDNRKSVDFWALKWAQENYYDRLKNMGCNVYTIVGNHTAYYKNTNNVSGVDLLLREYENVNVIGNPSELSIGGLKIMFIPWINSENRDETLQLIAKTNAQIAMGHLELTGFSPYRGFVMDHGDDKSILNKFSKVFSGHFHTRSNDGKIYYLGNPYEIYWNDVDDTRGFHIFDTETLTHTPVNNPFTIYKKIQYSDTPHQIFNYSEYENKFVKVIVKKKTDEKQFEKFIDKLNQINTLEVKVIENYDLNIDIDFEASENEDTISILNRYIEDSESSLNKSVIKKLISSIYKESCEVE